MMNEGPNGEPGGEVAAMLEKQRRSTAHKYSVSSRIVQLLVEKIGNFGPPGEVQVDHGAEEIVFDALVAEAERLRTYYRKLVEEHIPF